MMATSFSKHQVYFYQRPEFKKVGQEKYEYFAAFIKQRAWEELFYSLIMTYNDFTYNVRATLKGIYFIFSISEKVIVWYHNYI